MIRKRIVFKGRVQGVGFRFTAIRYANHLGLTGWVKNMSNGTVLMEVQGSIQNINRLISFLDNDHYIRIDSMNETCIEVIKEDTGFGLKSGY